MDELRILKRPSMREVLVASSDDRELATHELYFRRRGLPTLIEDYSAKDDILTRAWPWLAVLFTVQVVRQMIISYTPLLAGLVLAACIALILATTTLLNRRNGRPALALPEHMGWWSVAVFVLVPSLMRINGEVGVSPGIRHVFFNLFILAIVLGIIGWGLAPTIFWAIVRVLSDLGRQLVIVAKQMGTIFLFTVLLFFNQEIWQFADTSNTELFESFLVIFLLIAMMVLISGTPRLTRELIAQRLPEGKTLRRSQRANISMLLAVRQSIQVLVITVATTIVFASLSVSVISPALLESWKITATPVYSWSVEGTTFIATRAGALVAAFLGVIAGLNFAVVSLSSREGREQFMEGLEPEFDRIFTRYGEYLHRRKVLAQ